MISKIISCSIIGIDAHLIEVEVDIANGLPSFTTVGLPEAAVRESKERVKSALHNSGYSFPSDRITVNLAPANIRKEGTGFDLPIALGILAASGIIPGPITSLSIMGELSLDGRVKPVRGTLPMALAAKAAGHNAIIVPTENGQEAAVVENIAVYPVSTLQQAVAFLRGMESIPALHIDTREMFQAGSDHHRDFSEVGGQGFAKRALEVAAAGGHNLLML